MRQLDHVHFESGKRKRHLFQTHYDWTAVPLGTFQKQQSHPGQPLTATAGSRNSIEDILALPLHILNTSQFGMLLWYLTVIT